MSVSYYACYYAIASQVKLFPGMEHNDTQKKSKMSATVYLLKSFHQVIRPGKCNAAVDEQTISTKDIHDVSTKLDQ